MQKKRIAAYFVFVCVGFGAAFFFLRNKNIPLESTVSADVKQDSLINSSLLSEFFDLENNGDGYISTEKAVSGKKSCKLSPSIEYGFSASKQIKDIPSFGSLKSISLTFECLAASKEDDALYVLSIDDADGKNLLWDGKPFFSTDQKNWEEIKIDYSIAPALLEPINKITLYAWNRNKKEFFIDNISVDFIGSVTYGNSNSQELKALNLFFDFESTAGLTGVESIIPTTAHSGKRACSYTKGREYGPAVSKKLADLGSSYPAKVGVSAWVYPLTDSPEAVLTASIINTKNETVFWEGKSTSGKSFPKNKWTKINALFVVPVEKLSPDDVLNVSVWNKGKTDIIIDDLEIVYGESPERRGDASKVDATAIYEKRFVAEKNKPPFNTIYLQKQEINNKNSFSITSDKKDELSPNDQFIVGDFYTDKNSVDEVLCVGFQKTVLFSYSSETKQFKKIWGIERSDNALWNQKNAVYSGDFNTDGTTDILLVDKNNSDWTLVNFKGNEWVVVAKGTDPKKEWIIKNDLPKGNIISAGDIVMPVNFEAGKQAFLKLNTDWRFDLKLIEQDASGFTILGNIDFKGYPEDHNPKYYESVKVVPGHFLSKGKTSLLVVMCNCADSGYKGVNCNQIENLSFLPNSVQLYRVEEK